ncbi:MAG: thiamine phosphate synthase, partial [Gemmatimonadetes bacterium]|nr:thiamine phosphate synthase [Gemmatimonadota bacterium]
LRDEGLDYLFMGAAYATASHPERTPAGPDAVSTAAAQAAGPVLAIGGVTPARVRELAALGVYGVAVLSGVWGRERPDRAVARYLQVLEEEGLQ